MPDTSWSPCRTVSVGAQPIFTVAMEPPLQREPVMRALSPDPGLVCRQERSSATARAKLSLVQAALVQECHATSAAHDLDGPLWPDTPTLASLSAAPAGRRLAISHYRHPIEAPQRGQQDLDALRDLIGGCELLRNMTTPTSRRNEDHPHRPQPRQMRSIVTRA